MRDLLFVAALFISIWCTIIIIALLRLKNDIPFGNMFFMAVGYTAVLTRVLGLW